MIHRRTSPGRLQAYLYASPAQQENHSALPVYPFTVRTLYLTTLIQRLRLANEASLANEAPRLAN
jgi:hypothetical protein